MAYCGEAVSMLEVGVLCSGKLRGDMSFSSLKDWLIGLEAKYPGL